MSKPGVVTQRPGGSVDEGLSPQLRSARSIGGKALILLLSVVVAAFFVLNLVSARTNQKDAKRARVLATMMSDTSAVKQTWATTPEGMTATFVAVDPTVAGRVNDIRAYLKAQRIQHLRADYSDVRFEGKPLPGRPELESGTENLKLNVVFSTVPNGGRLTWIGVDSDRDIMKAALLEWSESVRSR